MITANDRQVGGAHYLNNQYQHWDYAYDMGLSYPEGCATKYLTRWSDKNGVEDLQKALHYIEKLIEQEKARDDLRGDFKKFPSERLNHQYKRLTEFYVASNSISTDIAVVLRAVVEEEYQCAYDTLRTHINKLLQEQHEQEKHEEVKHL